MCRCKRIRLHASGILDVIESWKYRRETSRRVGRGFHRRARDIPRARADFSFRLSVAEYELTRVSLAKHLKEETERLDLDKPKSITSPLPRMVTRCTLSCAHSMTSYSVIIPMTCADCLVFWS